MAPVYPPAVLRYLRAIRNPAKRAYGFDYADWRIGLGPEPERPAGLGYMAAQAVRLELLSLMGHVGGETFTS